MPVLLTTSTAVRLRAAGVWPLAVTGFVASSALVVAAGRSAVPVGVELERSFAGLLAPTSGSGTLGPVAVLLALAVLVAAWWTVLRRTGAHLLGTRAVAWTGAAWVLPLLVGPPLLSLDAYAYLAQGTMLAQGLDPYSAGPVLLGDDPAARRVDPMWRSAPVPYGPITLVLLRAVVLASDDLVTGVLLLRLLAVLGVAAAVGAALRLAPAGRRPHVLALCALNPVTLVHLVGGAHVDAVLAGIVGLALLALRAERPWAAWLLAAAAVAVKVTAAPLLLLVLVVLLRRHRARVGVLALAAASACWPWLLSWSVVPRPWGFVAALTVPGASAPWYAPATIVGEVLGLALPDAVARPAGRLVVLLVGTALVLRLALAERHDDGQDRSSRTAARAATALLLVPLCLPAVYGWYLAAGLFGLAAVGTPVWTGLLIALSSALAFGSLPPLYGASRWPLALTGVVAVVGLAAAAVRASPLASARVTSAAASARRAAGAHRPSLRLAQVAGVGLLVPAAVGLLSPGATASTLDERAQAERARVVAQAVQDYPQLQVVSVMPSGAGYHVELVRPGEWTCSVSLGRPSEPLGRFPRRVETGPLLHVRTVADRVC